MLTFRYRDLNHWYKGNCHIHSTASDGGKSTSELARMYADQGYDFLFRTDHWVTADLNGSETSCPLLWLEGVELHGEDPRGSMYHVVCLGRVCGIDREMGLLAAMHAAREQGALLILAHPHWMGNSLEEALRWEFDGVEVYNYVCHWLNGKSDGLVHWNAMLQRAPGTLALAVDDAHIRPEHPGWNGAWMMVDAAEFSRTEILRSIRLGRYYSTCGPQIEQLAYEDSWLTVRTSPIQFARLVGPNSRGQRVGAFDGTTFQEVTLQVPDDWSYVYLEVEDACGKRAWTNHLFVERGETG